MLADRRGLCLVAMVGGIVSLLTACSSTVQTTTGSPPTAIVVSVTGPDTVTIGTASQFTATVTGTSNQNVVWEVNSLSGGSAQSGTISGAGLYTPPASMPASPTVSITAVSAVDSTVSNSISVKLQASSGPVATVVTVAGPATINLGTTAQYNATVAGSSNQSVTWSVNGIKGGDATFGTIATSGMYTPPVSVPAANGIVIAATSAVSSNVSGTLSATILDSAPVIQAATGSTMNGGQTFLIDVEGSGFMTGATILVGGSPATTTAVTQSDLQTTITTPGGQPSQISVAVQNPTPGQTQSNAVTVTLTIPVATATAAARFLDQTSFGPTAASIAHVQKIGLVAALNEQFAQPTTLFSEPPSPDSECTSGNTSCTQSDFLKVTEFGNDQLRQRVALALSEIWVAPIWIDNAMPLYLNTLANDAFTNYRTIMQDATLSPAMGDYLNMVNSGKPWGTVIANENFGREMMQLFSLGPNLLNPDGTVQVDANNVPLPTYTEAQVEAFARAYTGWTYALADGSSPPSFNSTQNWLHAMVPMESQHDQTAKILMNGTTLPAGQTSEQDLKGALDNIFAHPNVGPFICRQLIQHLVTGDPSPAYVQRVVAAFDNNGSGVRGDMQAVLTAIVMDQEARAGDTQTGDQAESNPAIDGGHLREPLLWTLNLVRGLNATQTTSTDVYPFVSFMRLALAAVGEAPFSQTSVFNYYPPSYVIPQTSLNAPEFAMETTATIVPRLTLADKIIHNQAAGLTIDLSSTSILGIKAADPAALVDYLGMIFMHSQMPTDVRTLIISAVSAIPASNPQERAEVATYLVVTSSQYKIIH